MKHPDEIDIYIIRREIEDGLLLPEQKDYACKLGDKIREYSIQIGYTNANVLAIVAQLMTTGKVRVDFRSYTERLQLVGETEDVPIERIAVTFNRFMEDLKKSATNISPNKATQMVIVQPLTPLKSKVQRSAPN